MFKDKMEMLVKALPKYKKGKGQLRDQYVEEFCCLGVACDLYMKETGIGEWAEDGKFCIKRPKGESSYFCYLPPDVQEWLGAESGNGVITSTYPGVNPLSLTHINDSSDDWGPVIEALEKHWEEI